MVHSIGFQHLITAYHFSDPPPNAIDYLLSPLTTTTVGDSNGMVLEEDTY